MVRLIAHRGNTRGPSDRENHPDHVQAALDLGYDVEVDVWLIDDIWYFGHDEPQWRVDPKFLCDNKLWLHCKNIEAFAFLAECNANHHYFWHEKDTYTLTSRHFVWTYPGCELPPTRGIAVLPEQCDDWDIVDAAGICSDWITRYG